MKSGSPFAHLRPTTVPEMLDRAYAVASRFWVVIWGAGVVYGSDHLLALYFTDSASLSQGDPVRVGTTLVMALIGYFAVPVALLAVFQGLIFPQRPLSRSALFRTAFRKFPAFFLTHLAYLFLLIFIGVIAWALLRNSGSSPGFYQALPGMMLGLLGAWLGIRLCLAPLACIIEDGSPVAAFRRSWHLTSARGSGRPARADKPAIRWLSLIILPLLVALGLSIAGLSFGVIVLGIPFPGTTASRQTGIMMEILAFAVNALAMPLYWVGLMALYVEYRMRYEALDFYLRLRELSRDLPENFPAKTS